jgi:hypothetical protein
MQILNIMVAASHTFVYIVSEFLFP